MNKTISFDLNKEADLFSILMASFRYNGVEFSLEKEGDVVYVKLK